MGYTHYWDRQKRYNKRVYNHFITDVRKLDDWVASNKTANYGGPSFRLRDALGGSGTRPHIAKASHTNKNNPGALGFNGDGEEGHESFCFDRVISPGAHAQKKPHPTKSTTNLYFDFCKTAQKPYDLMVCACLILARAHFGEDIQVLSDGEQQDWDHALDFVNDCCGYNLDIMFSDGIDNNGMVQRVGDLNVFAKKPF